MIDSIKKNTNKELVIIEVVGQLSNSFMVLTQMLYEKKEKN